MLPSDLDEITGGSERVLPGFRRFSITPLCVIDEAQAARKKYKILSLASSSTPLFGARLSAIPGGTVAGLGHKCGEHREGDRCGRRSLDKGGCVTEMVDNDSCDKPA